MLCYNYTIITVWTLQLEMRWQCRHLSPRWFVTNTLCAWGHLSNDWLPIFPTLSGEGYMLHDAGSPEAGTHNKTNLDDEPLQDRCSEGPRWFIVRFLAKSWHDAVAVWTATPAPAPVDYNTKFPKYSMYIYVKDWLYIVKLLHSPVVASSGGKGGEAQLIGCPTQVTLRRSVIQLDSEKISRIERCNETDRMIISIYFWIWIYLLYFAQKLHICILVKIDRIHGISDVVPSQREYIWL